MFQSLRIFQNDHFCRTFQKVLEIVYNIRQRFRQFSKKSIYMKCSIKCERLSEFPGLLQNFQECSGIFLEYSRDFCWNFRITKMFPKFSKRFHNVLESSYLCFQNIQEISSIFEKFRKCSKMFKQFLNCFGMFYKVPHLQNVPKFSNFPKIRNLQKCSGPSLEICLC